MTDTTPDTLRTLALPSDQDASGRTLGEEELAALALAIRSGVLTSTKGTWVRRFEDAFASRLGIRHAIACSSGTAAIHAAVAAIDPEPGDEIVVSPVTDMGALTPILYQGAIPVFADIDPVSWNVTADAIAAQMSERTRAIVVTHLFGNPCDMDAIEAIAARAGIPVIEDCAQAFLARHRARNVGTIGRIGCFSLQQGKHITTGEGGIVVTDDDALARRVRLFVNKAWGYGDPQPDHYFLALNYRMSELQGAVAAAQLPKLDGVVGSRRRTAAQMTEAIAGLPGIAAPATAALSEHAWWKYCIGVDDTVIEGGPVAIAGCIKKLGIPSAPRYIQKPAFECEVFRERRTFGGSGHPFTLARPQAIDYDPARFPGTYRGLARALVLPWNEHYGAPHVAALAEAIADAARALSRS